MTRLSFLALLLIFLSGCANQYGVIVLPGTDTSIDPQAFK